MENFGVRGSECSGNASEMKDLKNLKIRNFGVSKYLRNLRDLKNLKNFRNLKTLKNLRDFKREEILRGLKSEG